MGRYNNYRTKQCTHTSWWLVLGWVTTKEYHSCIRFRNDTLHVNIELHLYLHYIYKVYKLGYARGLHVSQKTVDLLNVGQDTTEI